MATHFHKESRVFYIFQKTESFGDAIIFFNPTVNSFKRANKFLNKIIHKSHKT